MKWLPIILIKLRNLVWSARRRINGDRFERARDDWCCGTVFEFEIINLIGDSLYGTPEIDCALQFEEKGQLLSLHWYMDEKYQLHVRLFSVPDSKHKEYCVHAHTEIRPDYDPVAHIMGKELENGCLAYRKVYYDTKERAARGNV